MARRNITPRDKDVLDYIENYILEYGYAPSYREIGEGVGINSTSCVKTHLDRLIEAGVIETQHEYSPRALRSTRIKMVLELEAK